MYAQNQHVRIDIDIYPNTCLHSHSSTHTQVRTNVHLHVIALAGDMYIQSYTHTKTRAYS